MASFFTWVSLAIFCLAKCQVEVVSSASLSLVGAISHWCMKFVWVMAAVELHVNVTYAQHPALKSVYGKYQSVIAGNYIPSGQCLAVSTGSSRDSKTSDLNSFYQWSTMKHLSRKKHLQYKIGYSHHFYVLYYYHKF